MGHAKSIGMFGLNLVGMIAIFPTSSHYFGYKQKMPRKENSGSGYSLLLSESEREGIR
jgi:hypothetical protein